MKALKDLKIGDVKLVTDGRWTCNGCVFAHTSEDTQACQKPDRLPSCILDKTVGIKFARYVMKDTETTTPITGKEQTV